MGHCYVEIETTKINNTYGKIKNYHMEQKTLKLKIKHLKIIKMMKKWLNNDYENIKNKVMKN